MIFLYNLQIEGASTSLQIEAEDSLFHFGGPEARAI